MTKSILVVDDNEKIRQLLRHFFKSHPVGFEVYEAGDGVEAVEMASRVNPDLIILDLSMPRLNGLGAARQIRDMKIEAPIILFTMHGNDVSGATVTSTGVNAVVMKPDLTALHRQVEFFLSRPSPKSVPDFIAQGTTRV